LAPPRKRSLGLALALLLLIVSLVAGAPPAAAGPISPKPPHSPNAEDINTLYWIGLVAIVLLITVVNVALLYAVRRYRADRGAEPRQVRSGRGIQLRAGAALGLLALVLFVLSIVYTEKAREAPPTGPNGLQASSTLLAQRSLKLPPASDPAPLRIDTTGQQWLWRYDYPNGAFSYYRLVVPVDTTVVLDLLSTDVVHTWYVPELAGKFDAVPGKVNHVYFRADEEGTYFGDAATFSGASYAAMRTEVKVVSPEEYQTFIEQQKRDIEAAQQHVIEELSSGPAP
jgi:heme/copper-type cytochrome/quinol oxidase subunit 2